MKNLKNILALISLVALFVAVGCQKTPAPVPTPAAPVITLIGVPTAPIVYADSVSFSWNISGKVDSTILNGKKVAQNGSFTSGRLLADQDYTLRATGPGGSDSKTVSIKVGDWTTSTYGMISHGHWIFDSLGYKTQDMSSFYMYTHAEINPLEFDVSHYFYPDGVYEEKSISSGKTIISIGWNLSPQDSISYSIGGDKFFIKEISLTKVVLIETGDEYDASTNKRRLAWFRWVYKRNNSK